MVAVEKKGSARWADASANPIVNLIMKREIVVHCFLYPFVKRPLQCVLKGPFKPVKITLQQLYNPRHHTHVHHLFYLSVILFQLFHGTNIKIKSIKKIGNI